MMKKLLQFCAFFAMAFGFAQECPDLINPVDGETDVPVDATITWEAVPGVPAYEIRLGTTPGGNDLADAVVGSATSFTPPLGLPENTQIFVTIVLSFFGQGGGADIVCDAQSFTTEDVTTPPGCTQMVVPMDGATGVSVFTNISWLYAPRATSYDISIGTAPGLGDLFMVNDIVSLNFFPPVEFPPNTQIFVEITPKNENGPNPICQEFSFTTREVAPLPSCTNLISPVNGSVNIPLTPFLEWNAVPGATGYRVSIGSTSGGTDILNNAVFNTTSTFVIEFDPNQTFFITIIPFNDSGDAIGCGEETFSTLLGCGPFLDTTTGEFVTLSPDITLPEVFSFCENADPLTVMAPPGADGYRWFRIDPFGGNTAMISEETEVTISETGEYFLEAFNIVSQPGGVIECPTVLEFDVVSSEIATIDNLDIRDTALGLEITVNVSGIGDYEYAIDNIDGPYQDSNVFREVTPGTHTLYVRDRNGCGIVQETFEQDLTVEGFPKFFTPNGDNVNDFWQFIQPIAGQTIVLVSIEIYDRYGKLLRQIDQDSQGWDGTFNGRPLPSGGYWFRAVEDDGDVVRGNFTLKR
ncbi:MAG: T9SS type B sorting domain-containing protein [Bacteroidota bacterium]